MELEEAMRTTATVRYYTDDPVDESVLYRVFEQARFAPNGGNRQGWHVIVVTDPEMRRQLRDLYLQPWTDYVEHARSGGLAPRSERVLRQADEFAHALHEIPVHLVVCARMAALAITDLELDRTSIVGGASIYPFVQNILLATRAEGLGAALTTVLCFVEPQAKDLLEIPKEYGIATLIAVGHPDPERLPRQLTRAPVEEFTSRNRFDGDRLANPAKMNRGR